MQATSNQGIISNADAVKQKLMQSLPVNALIKLIKKKERKRKRGKKERKYARASRASHATLLGSRHRRIVKLGDQVRDVVLRLTQNKTIYRSFD